MPIPYLNDGSGREPYLRVDIVDGNLNDLPEHTTGYGETKRAICERVKAAGFGGIQNAKVNLCQALGLRHATSGHIRQASVLSDMAAKAQDEGHDCLTLHAGIGLESDEEINALIEGILTVSEKLAFPVYLETHRATITQDMFRTVKMVERFPEIRFNGDFSHWYTGQEMGYDKFGYFEEKLDFIAPVLHRVAFMHGRIGSSGCIQIPTSVCDMEPHIHNFKTIWSRVFENFKSTAEPGDYIVFAPELLSSLKHYARKFLADDGCVEEGDRLEEAIRYKILVEEVWNNPIS